MKTKVVIWLLLFSLQYLMVTGKKNVLFIISDDLRPQLGAYQGASYPSDVDTNIFTPNLDELASKSLVLTRAYTQYALCGPSRASFLTSRRVSTTLVNDHVTHFRSTGNFTSLPQHFSHNGYRTFGMGKIFHESVGTVDHNPDPISWTEPYFYPPSRATWRLNNISWLAVSESDIETHGILPDEENANQAIKVLRQVANDSGDEPFFLAVGFFLPHLAFIFPERFLDLYPRESINLPSNPYIPENLPDIAYYTWANPARQPGIPTGELGLYADHVAMNLSTEIGTTYPDERVIDLRRAYYCSISYVDELVGRVLKELKDLGLSDNTVVTFTGDHGLSLGENAEWSKVSNFEQSTHTPMMIHIPGVTDKGIRTDALVELTDLYPTVVEAAGLEPIPLCPEDSRSIPVCTEGMSMMPLMRRHPGPWKDAAFSQIERTGGTGYSMRTGRYCYTEWPAWLNAEDGAVYDIGNRDNKHYEPDWSQLLGVELYDHVADPLENVNVADYPQYSDDRKELSRKLREGWRAAMPKLTCYSCKNAGSHEDCNMRTEQCGKDELCMTEISNKGKGKFSVTKHCSPSQACEALTKGVKCSPERRGQQKQCWYCCNKHLCNDD